MTARRRWLLVALAVLLLACQVHVSVHVTAVIPVLMLVVIAELAFLALIGCAILRALTGWSVRE